MFYKQRPSVESIATCTLRFREVLTSFSGNSWRPDPFLGIVRLYGAPRRMSRVQVARGHGKGRHGRGMRVMV